MSPGPLSASERAETHAQLAVLERAGVPVAQAVGMLRSAPMRQAQWRAVVQSLETGKTLAQATVGLFTPLESAVLRAAIQAGSPALAHERLAAAAATQARRAKQLRARLLMPLAVFAIALFLLPLPALIAGSIGGGAYLAQTVGRLLALAGIIWLVQKLAQRFELHSWGAARVPMELLLLRLPLFGDLLVRKQAQIYFENLALLLGCGVPMFDALPTAADTLSMQIIRDDYARLLSRMQSGLTLAQAANMLEYPGNSALTGMIASGEGSGELPQLLAHYAQAEGVLVAERTDTLATWIPRLVYVALLVWMAQGLFAGFAPIVKPDY